MPSNPEVENHYLHTEGFVTTGTVGSWQLPTVIPHIVDVHPHLILLRPPQIPPERLFADWYEISKQ